MMAPLSFLRAHAAGVVVSIKVQPRASRNELGEVLGPELKIKVTAPPVDSAANEALIRFLADLLGCSKNSVQLLRGHASRHKQILVAGFGLESATEKFRQRLK